MKPKSEAGQRLLDAAHTVDNPYLGIQLPDTFMADAIVAIEDESVQKTLLAAGVLLGGVFPKESRAAIEDAVGFTLGHVVAGAQSEMLRALRHDIESLRGTAAEEQFVKSESLRQQHWAGQTYAYDEVLRRIDGMLADQPLTLVMEEPPA